MKFKVQGWVQCTWADKEAGYLYNRFDGGMFHRKFNMVEKIEDYGEDHNDD